MSKRKQHILADKAQITTAFLSELKHGRKNASAPIADRLAEITGTDIRVWLKGGPAADRVRALDDWARRQSQ